MSNVNLLTLELSQSTDSNILIGNSADRKKEGSTLFSTVMEQHKEQTQNGKDTSKYGNIEYRSEYRQPEKEVSSKKNDDIDMQESNIESGEDDSVFTQLKENKSEQSSGVKNEDITQNIVTSSQNKQNDNAEDLLLFLNAAENTLVQSNEVLNKHVILTEALIENKKDIVDDINHNSIVRDTENSKAEVIVNHSKTSKENVITDAEVLAKKEVVAPKLDKTLIAQSVSEQVITDQKVLDKGSSEYQKLVLTENSKNEKQNVVGISKASDTTDDKRQVSTLKQKNSQMNNPQESEYSDIEKVSKEKLASYLSDEGNTKAKGNVSSEKASEIDAKPNNLKVNKEIKSNELLGQLAVEKLKPTDEAVIISNIVIDDKTIVKESNAFEKSSISSNRIMTQPLPANLTQNQQSSHDSNDAKKHQAKSDNAKGEVPIVIDELSKNEELKPLTGNAITKSKINPLFDTLSQHEMNKTFQQENRFIQNELSFENVMQNISADAVQTHKNTLIQQAETLSIMRKDFTDAVKDKVMVMINQKIQQIDIQLDSS